ncbi:MAG: hypothetical protein ACKV2U_04290 [Bryobacteraceae bacterium]
MAGSVAKKAPPRVDLAARPKNAPISQALKRIAELPPDAQDTIGALILETLDTTADSAVERFQSLIEQKYTRGLNSLEAGELLRLEAEFRKSDECFYAPLLERVASRTGAVAPRRKPSLTAQ